MHYILCRYASEYLEAARAGDMVKLRAQVRMGVDVNQVNNQGWNAIMYAAAANQAQSIEFLSSVG